MAGETGNTSEQMISADQLLGFMNGSTLEAFTDLAQRFKGDLDEASVLAELLAKGTRTQLVGALKEILTKEPELAESPAVKKLEAEARPQHKHMPLLLACIDADVPAYLHGEAGSTKSTAAEIAADMRGLDFRGISYSPLMPESRINGFIDANGTYHRTGFREIFEHGGLFIHDEIDNGNPSLTTLINRSMANFVHEFPDRMVDRNWIQPAYMRN